MAETAKQAIKDVMAQLTAPDSPFEVRTGDDHLRYFVNAPPNLVAACDSARGFAEQEFLVYQGERWTYADYFARVDQLAAALQARGVKPGDRLAIAMRNYPEWMVVFLAIVNCGAVVVPLNSWGMPDELHYALTDAGAQWVFCDQARFDGLQPLLAGSDLVQVLVRPAADADAGALTLDALLAESDGADFTPVQPDPGDPAIMMYTSGTTGRPKGALSTHGALGQALMTFDCAAAGAAMTSMDAITAMLERGFAPTTLLAVPLFHVSGCHAQFLTTLRGGRRMVVMYKWDVAEALRCIETERVTTVAAAPSMILDLLRDDAFEAADTSSLAALGIGGAATPGKVIDLMNQRLPSHFSGTGWGMTETNGQGASLTGALFMAMPASAGLPHPIVDIEVRGDDGQPLPAGEAGELWVRSCTLISEYWQRPDANASDFRDGWFCSGDVGYLDADGFLFLADRAKDMVIRGGENIYPAEIENLLLELPQIAEVAVIGLPHERLGEEVAAVVVLQPGAQLDAAGLSEFANGRLAAYKLPTRVAFTPGPLPRNATRKVLKNELREQFEALAAG